MEPPLFQTSKSKPKFQQKGKNKFRRANAIQIRNSPQLDEKKRQEKNESSC